MTLKEKTDSMVRALAPIYDSREARNITEIAIEHIKGWSRVDILMNSDKEISDYFAHKLDEVLARLLKNEPIQYITGETYWHGLTLKVNPGVLIPRPETSELVDIISDDNKQPDLRVLDLGTGSGAIAIALSRSLNFPEVTATDISDKALATAKDNNRLLNTGVSFIKSDMLAALPFPDGSFDIIVSNPPYICESERSAMRANVLDYEPATALFVPDNDPLRFYRAIADEGYRTASQGGRLYLEINPTFADKLKQLLTGSGWKDVTILKDMYGKNRFIKACK